MTYARKIWREAKSAKDTLAEDYLRARGYQGPIPETLRFHAGLWHAPSRRDRPALVGKVTHWPLDDLVGIHRTYLAYGSPTKAPVGDSAKMSLGRIKAGAVRLGKVKDALVVGEGIETTLCAAALAGLPGWAVLGSWNFRHVVLPFDVNKVVIAVDHDEAGREGAAALRANLRRKGIACTIALPPEPGTDWADIAISEGRR